MAAMVGGCGSWAQRPACRRVPFACQSGGGSGLSVGRRSAVSSSSTRCASLASDQSSARAIRSTESHVGLAMPASMPSIVRWVRPARSATSSGLRPSSRRRSPMARPRARCGVGLRRTSRKDSAHSPRLTTKHVSGMILPMWRRRLQGAHESVGVVGSAGPASVSFRKPVSTSRRW